MSMGKIQFSGTPSNVTFFGGIRIPNCHFRVIQPVFIETQTLLQVNETYPEISPLQATMPAPCQSRRNRLILLPLAAMDIKDFWTKVTFYPRAPLLSTLGNCPAIYWLSTCWPQVRVGATIYVYIYRTLPRAWVEGRIYRINTLDFIVRIEYIHWNKCKVHKTDEYS